MKSLTPVMLIAALTVATVGGAAAPTLAAEDATADAKPEAAETRGPWAKPAPEGVGVTEMLDEQIPLELSFTDSAGQTVQLRDMFKYDKPVVLVMNYYQCPMMCGVILNATVDALTQTGLEVGKDYHLLSVSFDDTETAALANQKKINYVGRYLNTGGQGDPEAGFHFLVGEQASIDALAESIGYEFFWSDIGDQFVHPSAIVILTPQGRISQYFHDLDWQFEPERRLRGSLVNASDGKIGSFSERVSLMFCNYHPEDGTYSASAFKIMRVAAPLLGIGLVLGIVRFSIRRARAASSAEPSAD
jgi:protein SCO1/2